MIMWDKKTGERLHPSPALARRIAAAFLLSTPLATCATPTADDGYPSNSWGEKARETDKEIRKLENERDTLNHEGIKTQADAMRKAFIEKRLGDLYDKKLGRKRW